MSIPVPCDTWLQVVSHFCFQLKNLNYLLLYFLPKPVPVSGIFFPSVFGLVISLVKASGHTSANSEAREMNL